MADDKKAPIIIIKRIKKGGHGAAHGGAWKVAFADFMTAMMAFFLVMWLLGSDEEVKSAVAQYFSNPSSAYRPELATDKAVPLGDRTGAGDTLLAGAMGMLPEDLVERPSRQFKTHPEPKESEEPYVSKELSHTAALELLDIDHLEFAVREELLFEPGSDELLPNADRYLQKVGKVLKGYDGYLTVQGYTLPAPRFSDRDQYELSVARVVTIKKYLMENGWVSEFGKISPKVKNDFRESGPHSRVPRETRAVEFLFTQVQ